MFDKQTFKLQLKFKLNNDPGIPLSLYILKPFKLFILLTKLQINRWSKQHTDTWYPNAIFVCNK